MDHGGSSTSLDDLISAALTRRPYNQQRLGREAERYARQISKARAPDLAEDLHQDVCVQAFVELFQADEASLARYGGKGLFRRAVLAAIRAVRAQHAAPGQRTRTAAMAVETPRAAAEDVGRAPGRLELKRAMVVDGGFERVDFDLLPSAAAAAVIQQVEDAADIDRILAAAPPRVARALRLIHLSELPVELVAAEAMISRFALNREIKAFCGAWRAAA